MYQLRHYWRYFFFFFSRFNPLLAILLLIDEWKGEVKYRLFTTGFEEIENLRKQGIKVTGAFSYMPSNYVLMERAFRFLHQEENKGAFLDIGCGKGRAMAVAAGFGYRKIIGVEVISAYCRDAWNTVESLKGKHPSANFEIHCADALFFSIPESVGTIFLYNPFNETVLEAVVENIRSSLERHPRTLYVVYINPLFKDVFTASGFVPVYQTSRFSYLKASVLKYDPKENPLDGSPLLKNGVPEPPSIML